MFFPNHCFPLIKALIKKPLVLHVFWVPQTLRCFVRFPPVISSPGHKRSSKVVAFWISSLRAVASKVFTSLTPRTWQADAERNNGRFNKRGWCLSVMNIYIYISYIERERERCFWKNNGKNGGNNGKIYIYGYRIGMIKSYRQRFIIRIFGKPLGLVDLYGK